MNIMMLLEMAASGYADRAAFIDAEAGTSITYQQLFGAAGVAAKAVQLSGASRLAMLDVSSLATPIGLFASGWAGVPYVPLNYRLTDEEIAGLLGRIKPVKLVTEPHRMLEFESATDVIAQTRNDFLASARSGGDVADPWSMDPEETAVLLFTSGTTGAPKAAVLRHKHLVSYILGSVEFMSAEEDDAALVCVPPYHVAGIAAMLSSVYAGRRVVQLANFTAPSWIELARTEKITTAFVVPTMLVRIIDALEGEAPLPHLQSLAYGGGRMPLTIIKRAMELMPDTDFSNAYGLTETSSTITVLGPEEHRAAVESTEAEVQQRLVSVGVALPGIEVEIRDAAGRLVEAGERGEIYVRGEQVSGEYEGRGSVIDDDGWFPTRDAGFLDPEGYLFLDGRADDVIVRGGENFSPGEIEDVLLEHDAVADVAVAGVASEQWGEVVIAAVVLQGEATVEELQVWVKDHLRSSRVPERIQFWDELPYTETGKLLRRLVKARFL